jgi:alpha-glucosidase
VNEPWWKTAVFYQIYPRSFKDSNSDGTGDLPGIISKLDYLVELGINALWVSPFFKSPMADFGYDISDYRQVDPVFGTFSDAKKLITEAHLRSLKIIFDLVINHTSDEHPWFVDARSSKDNPKHDWYIWRPCLDETSGRQLPVPNNWVSQFEFKSAWWKNTETNEWYLGTFTHHQPEVNWRNQELKSAMYNVIKFWLDQGVDGFRMDVVNWFIKDEKFRSNPFSFNANPDIFQKHIYDRNQEETHTICKEIRAITDLYSGNRVLVGEIFTQNATAAASYQGKKNDELHLSFNMELLYLKWNARSFAKALSRWYTALPPAGWPNITLSNHDQPRHAKRFATGNPRHQASRMQISAMFLLTTRGTPFLYYGEEIGMTNTVIPRKELVDPTGITFWPLPLGRDGERTPMQWSATESAGFSAPGVKPWLRINRNKEDVNVESQQKNPESLWHWYRTLITLRTELPVLQTGSFRFLEEGKRGVLAFRRTLDDTETGRTVPSRTVDCYLNFSTRPRTVILPGDVRVLLGNYRKEKDILARGKLVLAEHEALLVSF